MVLCEAFGFAPGAMVAAVGGGGKTSLVFRLAAEASERGIPAVVTTTVKFTRPAGMAMPPLVTAPPGSAVEAAADALARAGAITLSSGEGDRGRMLGYAPEVVDRLRQPGRLVLVEADGSAHRPFKAPAEHEPVIPAGATDVVVCAGLQVLGRPLDERWVHRPELAAGLAGVAPGSPVTPGVAATVLLAQAGGRKGVPPGARCHALLNVAGEAAPGPEALELARRLADGGYDRVVIADARRGIVFEVMGRAMVSAPAADHR